MSASPTPNDILLIIFVETIPMGLMVTQRRRTNTYFTLEALRRPHHSLRVQTFW